MCIRDRKYIVCCVLIGGSCVDIKTEADSNDITECPHDDKPTTGMFGLSDAVFSAFICLCIVSLEILLSVVFVLSCRQTGRQRCLNVMIAIWLTHATT